MVFPITSGAPFRFPSDLPIPCPMARDRRLEEIAAAFADAVAEGDLAAAEGWLAVAAFVAGSAQALELERP